MVILTTYTVRLFVPKYLQHKVLLHQTTNEYGSKRSYIESVDIAAWQNPGRFSVFWQIFSVFWHIHDSIIRILADIFVILPPHIIHSSPHPLSNRQRMIHDIMIDV